MAFDMLDFLASELEIEEVKRTSNLSVNRMAASSFK